ncbi:MAG: toprim domain-containing protein [Pseudomonadota bacterium]
MSCKTKKTSFKDNRVVAQRLWDRSLAIEGTPAEVYLVHGRGISTRPSSTLRFLPAYKDYPHALIAACALAVEAEPGVLEPPKTVPAIHLTELSENGQTKLGKRMLGPVSGHPICVAPPNDNLGLVIAEGIEDALSVHQATGLGAWAAGSAPHLAKLLDVVPDHIECVTLMQDDDEAGGKACDALARGLLRRDFEVRIVQLGGLSNAA